jgi:hypothetical protein
MDFSTTTRTLFAGTLCLGLACGVADADDVPVKAPPPAPVPVFDQLDVHGIFDLTFANDYITPRGLLVTGPHRLLEQD